MGHNMNQNTFTENIKSETYIYFEFESLTRRLDQKNSWPYLYCNKQLTEYSDRKNRKVYNKVEDN